MKQHLFFRLFTPALVVLIVFTANCAKSTDLSDKEVVKQLTDYLNSRHPGSRYTIDPAATIVKPLKNNRYEITLKNTSFTTDLTRFVELIYKYIWSEDSPYSELDTVRMEEVVFIFGPKEKYLDLRSIKDLSIENELKPKLTWPGGVELNKIGVSVGKITFQRQHAGDSQSSDTIEHLKINTSGLTAKNDKISFILDIEKIGKVDTGEEDANLSDYMMNKNTNQPNLKKALETGAAVTDLNIQLGKINVSMKKNGITLCDGILENASYLQFIKPDSGKFFKLGWGIRLKNLKLSIPGKKALQLLSQVKDFRFEFSIKPLSESAFLAFLDLMKEIFSSRTLPDNTKMGKFTPLVMRFVFEIMQSKTHMHFVISPFKHHFGEMKVEADMKLYNIMVGPIVTITATLFKAANILNKLKEPNIFSAAALETISGIIEKYGLKHENGDVTFTYNMDIYQLKKIFLNLGRLLPPTTHTPSNFLKY
jgi:hypothetical protein